MVRFVARKAMWDGGFSEMGEGARVTVRRILGRVFLLVFLRMFLRALLNRLCRFR